jgi:hypothetical protein
MNYPDSPQSGFSSSAVMMNRLQTATSGPELASFVPDPARARDLAQTIVSDQFELAERAIDFASARGSGTVLRLSRR